MYFSSEKGFTLIELLVVVAIIGILSTVVLASLGNARTKAKESKAMSIFGQIRAQAEIAFDNNSGSYATICSDTNILSMGGQAATAVGGTTTATGSPLAFPATTATAATGAVTCSANAGAYAAQIQLSATKWYCVDSAGKADSRSSIYIISSQTCA